ncbi:MAG: glycosyltransferase family 4 protein, partial [Clostridium celatum]|nr:glycosyltransferase family 4 protein [Clostridium celatum]
KSEKVRNEFNIPKDKTILGFVGRICEIKGIVPFIREFAKHKEEFIDCRVLLVGSGEQEQEVKQLLKELQLEELFILTGFQSDVYKFYPIIDVFFLPSLYEGLPMVLLEAMAFKKPVVSMDVGSISEVIKDGQTGVLVKLGKYTDFINKLTEIKSNIVIREKLEKNAFSYVNENFNIRDYVNYIECCYRRII